MSLHCNELSAKRKGFFIFLEMPFFHGFFGRFVHIILEGRLRSPSVIIIILYIVFANEDFVKGATLPSLVWDEQNCPEWTLNLMSNGFDRIIRYEVQEDRGANQDKNNWENTEKERYQHFEWCFEGNSLTAAKTGHAHVFRQNV